MAAHKEGKVETELRERLQAIGGNAFKVKCEGLNGWPDRFCIVPSRDPRIYPLLTLVETKAKGGRLSPAQENCQELLRKYRINPINLWEMDMVDEYVLHILKSGYGVEQKDDESRIVLPPGTPRH